MEVLNDSISEVFNNLCVYRNTPFFVVCGKCGQPRPMTEPVCSSCMSCNRSNNTVLGFVITEEQNG